MVPSEDCPADWPKRLADLLDTPLAKVGLGLRTDRLPPHCRNRPEVLAWEKMFWGGPWEQVWARDYAAAAGVPVPPPLQLHGAFEAPVDTTLAVYRPLALQPSFTFGRAVRTDFPYVADHLTWHEDGQLPADIAWYYAHADPAIPAWSPGKAPPCAPQV